MKTVLTAAMAAMVAFATMSTASAATVNSTGTLDPASGTPGLGQTNNFAMDLYIGGNLAAPNSTVFSGTLGVDVTHTGGVISDIQLNGGTISATDWVWNLGFLGNFEVAGIQATGASAASTAVTGTSFDATTQEILINAGTATGVGGALAGVSFDFGNPGDELPVPGNGSGTLTQSISGSNVNWQLTIPVDEFVEVTTDFGGVDLVAQGNLVVSGSFVVPEPTSGLFLASLAAGAGAVVRRRRK